MSHPEDAKVQFMYHRTFKEQFQLRKKLLIDCSSEEFANHFSHDQMKATIAGIVFLDLEYSLETFTKHLDTTVIDLFNFSIGKEPSDDYKPELAERAAALLDLSNELKWIVNYGCRLYM